MPGGPNIGEIKYQNSDIRGFDGVLTKKYAKLFGY